MTLLERYWPTLVAIPVMATVGFWLWSNQSEETVIEELPSALIQEEGGERGTLDAKAEEELPTSLGRPQGRQILEPIQPSSSGAEYREILEVVPETPGQPERDYTQDSPEVKRALSQIKIEMYGSADCVDCGAARSFMSANHLKFADYNIETNSALKETAHDLGGSSGIPVIVIDGEVLRGFSQSAFQAKLTSAVRARIQQ